jgi:TrmH family RNA methyltransferase
MDAGTVVEAVYVAPEGRVNPSVAAVVDRAFASGLRVFDLGAGVIERVADTVHPQPVLAVVAFAPAPLELVQNLSTVMVLVDVRDPGNAGTMIRTADAAGVGAVIHCDGSVDPTNPKTVRASAGSVFQVPVVAGGGATEAIESLKSWGFVTVGTAVRNGIDYAEFDWRQRVALVFGNEAAGLDDGLMGRLDRRVTIPMVGRAESLNVGVSASVLCFEALRQRRGTSPGVLPDREPEHPTTGSSSLGSTISGMTPEEPGEPGAPGDRGA